LVFSYAVTKLEGIENATSWPKIGEITVNAAGAGAWADTGEARSAPNAAVIAAALIMIGFLAPGI
jgi:hypothetical protein